MPCLRPFLWLLRRGFMCLCVLEFDWNFVFPEEIKSREPRENFELFLLLHEINEKRKKQLARSIVSGTRAYNHTRIPCRTDPSLSISQLLFDSNFYPSKRASIRSGLARVEWEWDSYMNQTFTPPFVSFETATRAKYVGIICSLKTTHDTYPTFFLLWNFHVICLFDYVFICLRGRDRGREKSETWRMAGIKRESSVKWTCISSEAFVKRVVVVMKKIR